MFLQVCTFLLDLPDPSTPSQSMVVIDGSDSLQGDTGMQPNCSENVSMKYSSSEQSDPEAAIQCALIFLY